MKQEILINSLAILIVLQKEQIMSWVGLGLMLCKDVVDKNCGIYG
jgi:hypothetical protein